MKKSTAGRARRKRRIRKKVSGTPARPRLSVYRSAKHIYAQVIDDTSGTTLAARSSRSKDFSAEGDKTTAAREVGKLLAEACKEKGVEKVVFDRNGFIYHGRVKALAEGAREAGLNF
jgi:large subunit ribosomal protein L18